MKPSRLLCTPSLRLGEPATGMTSKARHLDWRKPATGIGKRGLSSRLEGACDRNGEISFHQYWLHQPLAARFLHCALRASVGMTGLLCATRFGRNDRAFARYALRSK